MRDISALAVWLVCAALYAALMTLVFVNPALLSGELGVVELGQVVILLISLALAVWLALDADTRWLRWWAILIAIGSFYLVTEESSWGWHYFHWELGWFAQFNDQGETNLHNSTSWLDQKPRAILLLGMILGTIVHPLVKHFRRGRGLFDNPWWLAPTLASLPPVIFSQLAAMPERLDELQLFSFSFQLYRSSEMEEFFMYLFFITYILSLRHRLMARKTAG